VAKLFSSDNLALAVAEPRVPAPAAEQEPTRALAASVARRGSVRHRRGAVGAKRKNSQTRLQILSREFAISLGVLLIPRKGPPLSIPTGFTTTLHGLSSRLLLGTGSGVGTVEETGKKY